MHWPLLEIASLAGRRRDDRGRAPPQAINTRKPTGAVDGRSSPLTMCPCTRQRVIDLEHGTIDGMYTNPFACPEWLADNPACSLSTYVGGVRCCYGHHSFLTDTEMECATPDCEELPVDRAYLKTTIYYEDVAVNTLVTDPGTTTPY